MKMGNLKIGTRLAIGFLLVILLTLTVGGMAFRQVRVLSNLVDEMYDHPLIVGYTMRDIRSEIDRMHDQMLRLLLIGDAAESDALESGINEAQVRVLNKFDLVMERFLGDKDNVAIAQRAFIEWKKKLDQEFTIVRSGKRDKPDSAFYLAWMNRTDELNGKLQVMIDFAARKAASFRDTADEKAAAARTTILGLLCATFLLSLAIAFFITRSIVPSLVLIVRRMRNISEGDLGHDVEIDQADEIGALAESFRGMQAGLRNKADVATAIAAGDLTQKVETNGRDDHLGNAINQMTLALQESKKRTDRQDWIKTGKNELNRIIAGQGDLKVLASDILGFFAGYLKVQIGTLYVMSDEGVLTHLGSYAADPGHGPAAAISQGEGLVGQAALEKSLISITGIPSDYIRITSSLGACPPRHILAVPLLFENTVQGVIELGAIETFTDDKLELLSETASAAGIAVHTVRNHSRLRALLEETQQQADQLQAQEEELRVTNEELEEQREELRAINEELEEKNEYLEEQKEKIFQKNLALEEAGRELAQRARELEVTSKYKSEFLANMSHELRTPLNSLLLLSRDLEENTQGNLIPDQVESAAIIRNSGEELLQLINEILDLSKIEAGRMHLKIDTVSLPEMGRSIERSFKPVADQKGLLFTVILEDGLPESIRTDSQRLRQILNNLVANALKFTEQGEVSVAFLRPSDAEANPAKSGLNLSRCVAFSIKDTGIGICEEKQMLIFEAFQQADSGTARKYGGTGLGLSIARELAKLLGGKIKLTSNPGQGSVFTLYLPLTHSPAIVDHPPGAETGTFNTVSGVPLPIEAPARYAPPESIRSIPDDREGVGPDDRCILIIEDDADFAKILFDQCHARGFKALVSATGENGLILAETYLPEAVLLDIRLPGLSGCTVLKTLKEKPATRHIPVHIISVEETSMENLQGGAIGFTTKPVNRRDLDEAFENIEQVVAKKIKDLLLVEDNADLRLGIVKLISDPDLNIVTVDSGAGALSALKERRFDCMILDIGLPDMTGFDLLNRMSAFREFNMPPVIVYTGKDLTRQEEMDLRKYAETIIIKGVKSEERLLDEVSLFLHKTVNAMPPAKREMIITLHSRDAMFDGKTILLVDDDMRNLFALSKILSEKGVTVLKAEDGRKALSLLETHPEIVLVLLDIMMPVMDGYQTAREIRKQSRFFDLPIIALTAKALKEDHAKCIAAGANDYLSKPVDMERLFSMLRVWLYRQECVL